MNFLPEFSKSVTDIDTFISNFHYLNCDQLLNVELPDFIVNSITNNIQDKSPIFCTNPQKRNFYYYDGKDWIKGTEFIHKLYSAIYKNAMKQIINDYNQILDDEGETDDDKILQNYYNSTHYKKQRILSRLCDCDKYPYNKCIEKVLNKLGKKMK